LLLLLKACLLDLGLLLLTHWRNSFFYDLPKFIPVDTAIRLLCILCRKIRVSRLLLGRGPCWRPPRYVCDLFLLTFQLASKVRDLLGQLTCPTLGLLPSLRELRDSLSRRPAILTT
jgi:hypothetical protein